MQINKKERADQGNIIIRSLFRHLADFTADSGDNHFQKMLPSGNIHFRGKIARRQPGTNYQNSHNQPCIENRHIDSDKSPTPEDNLIRADLIDGYNFHIELLRRRFILSAAFIQ